MFDALKSDRRCHNLGKLPLRSSSSQFDLIHCDLEERNTIILGAIPHIAHKEQIIVLIEYKLRFLYATTTDSKTFYISEFDISAIVLHLTKDEVVIVAINTTEDNFVISDVMQLMHLLTFAVRSKLTLLDYITEVIELHNPDIIRIWGVSVRPTTDIDSLLIIKIDITSIVTAS